MIENDCDSCKYYLSHIEKCEECAYYEDGKKLISEILEDLDIFDIYAMHSLHTEFTMIRDLIKKYKKRCENNER